MVRISVNGKPKGTHASPFRTYKIGKVYKAERLGDKSSRDLPDYYGFHAWRPVPDCTVFITTNVVGLVRLSGGVSKGVAPNKEWPVLVGKRMEILTVIDVSFGYHRVLDLYYRLMDKWEREREQEQSRGADHALQGL